MVKHDSFTNASDDFSPELTREVGPALNDYLLAHGTDPLADAKLRDLTNRVCAEAHELGLPPEKMLVAIKRLFERAPVPDMDYSDNRRQAFEKFLSGCIKAYFDEKPAP